MLGKVTVILSLFVVTALIVSERQGWRSPTLAGGEEKAATARAEALQRFGADVPAGNAVSVADVITNPAKVAGRTVLVEGIVRNVCQRKGCWMEVVDSKNPDKGGCRVMFKDYGFFVPTNSIGAKARMQGQVVVKTVQAEQVKHLEAEGAHFANKAPDGSANEVSIIASGVELRR